MTSYMLAPKGNAEAEANLVGMFEKGILAAYRVRSNGTLRPVNLLPIASTARETAEWVWDETEDGRSVESIAREIHVSVATVRRYLESLELTWEIEQGEWDDVWAETQGFQMPVDPTDVPDSPNTDTACAEDPADDLAELLAASLALTQGAAPDSEALGA